VQLHAGADPNVFRENLVRLTTKYMNERIEKRRERENIPDEFIVSEFGITALPDLHLDTNLNWEKSSDPKYSYILSGLGLLILIIASINYIALALTTSAARRVEVGIRKVAGAQRKQLVWQFTVESGVLALLSLIIGFGLVFLFLPFFNEFTGKMIALNRDTFVLLVFTGLALSLIVGVLAGSYPSFFLSGFRPAAVLKGRFTARVQAGFTKPLVVFQFALSAFLMISSVIMFRQMSFITQKDLGYSQDQVIVIPTHAGWNEESDKAIERFRNSASNEPTIARVSGTSSSFNQGWSRYGYRIDGETKFAYVYRVDTEYLDLLEIDLVAGRNFNEQIGSDTTAIIVNEALAKDMGWEDPLSEHLNWRNDTIGLGSKVIGVVKDYHFLSLERNIEPMFLSMSKKDVGYLTTLLVKLHAGSVASGLEKVRVIWQQLYPDKPFEYSFLDEDVAKQYDKHKRWTRIASFATFFAIFIACLGLFGLAGINAVNKTKEIGIRKVLGAGLTSIFVLLNKQYAGLACIAFLVAAPFSWYVMAQWLRGFQYSIELTWSVFVISMVSGIAIALLTVTYHGIRAALINPAETLKYE
jgi:putative ABC transport system permease protein